MLRLFNMEFEVKMVHGLPNPFPGPVVSHFDLACPRLRGLKRQTCITGDPG